MDLLRQSHTRRSEILCRSVWSSSPSRASASDQGAFRVNSLFANKGTVGNRWRHAGKGRRQQCENPIDKIPKLAAEFIHPGALDRVIAGCGVSHSEQTGGACSAFGDGVLRIPGLPNL